MDRELMERKLNLKPNDFRGWSDIPPEQLEQPHDPWREYTGESTRDNILGQYRFLFDTWHIAEPSKHRTADHDEPLIQAKYNLLRGQSEAGQFDFPKHHPSQTLPEQPLNFDKRMKETFGHPYQGLASQQQQEFDVVQNNDTADAVVAEIMGKEKKTPTGGASQLQNMIQKHFDQFEEEDEDPEETDEPSNPNQFAKTLPLTEKRGEVLQLKKMIQEISSSLGRESAGSASFSSLRMETLNSGLRTLEEHGTQIKRKNLEEMRAMLESAIRGIIGNPSLFAGGNIPKIRLILIFYIYILKLLETYQNQKRDDALQAYMESLVDAKLGSLESFLSQLGRWSRLSNQERRKLLTLLRGIDESTLQQEEKEDEASQHSPNDQKKQLLNRIQSGEEQADASQLKNKFNQKDLIWKIQQMGLKPQKSNTKEGMIKRIRGDSGQQGQTQQSGQAQPAEEPQQVGEEKTDEEEQQEQGGAKNPFKEVKKGIDFLKNLGNAGKDHGIGSKDFQSEDEIDALQLASPEEKKKMKQKFRKKQKQKKKGNKGKKKGKKKGGNQSDFAPMPMPNFPNKQGGKKSSLAKRLK
eukprot:gb/GECG01003937.1/.p1 GENE.gb/GECG01003937.1/~~gb/GECG01003937.1/.p1  ORF type:complete len:579 (+),score=115.28 gb/GECG01003937.1/:1-1737(+)